MSLEAEILNQLQGLVIVTDREQRIRWINEAATALYESTAEALIGRSWGRLIGVHIELFERVLQGESVELPRLELQTPSGPQRLDARFQPLREGGEITGAITHALPVSAPPPLVEVEGTRWQAALTHLPVGIFFFDRAGTLLEGHAGDCAQVLGGLRPQPGAKLRTLLGADFAEKAEAMLTRALDSRGRESIEHTFGHPSGPVTCRATGQAISEDEVVVVWENISALSTEREESARQLRELERRNQFLEAFTSRAAAALHEPLRIVGGFAELLEADHGRTLGEEGLGQLDRITDAATRMQTLVEDLLSFNRVATASIELYELDPRTLVRQALDSLAAYVRESDAEVEVGEIDPVTADPTLLRELLYALIDNALKFRREDTRPTIVIEGVPDEAAWVLQVRDNGSGFDPRFAERIFLPFRRLHHRSERAASGVGLTVAREIAHRFGGRIEAEGRPGEGATFTLTLPR